MNLLQINIKLINNSIMDKYKNQLESFIINNCTINNIKSKITDTVDIIPIKIVKTKNEKITKIIITKKYKTHALKDILSGCICQHTITEKYIRNNIGKNNFEFGNEFNK